MRVAVFAFVHLIVTLSIEYSLSPKLVLLSFSLPSPFSGLLIPNALSPSSEEKSKVAVSASTRNGDTKTNVSIKMCKKCFICINSILAFVVVYEQSYILLGRFLYSRYKVNIFLVYTS